MMFFDRLTVDRQPTFTDDGYMVASAPVARDGIQLYSGPEMGVTDKEVVRVLRPTEEVFSDATFQSFAHRPMTNEHPEGAVTADNWREVAIGYSGGEVARDGESVRVPLVMMDGGAIQQYQDGKRELSMGYSAEIDWTPGTTEDGMEYDAVQRNIKNNHIALVDSGRAGTARIGDTGGQSTAGKDTGGHQMATRKITVDGLTVETTDQGVEAIEKLQQKVTDAEKAHTDAVAAKDSELAKRDATIDDLKSKVLDESQMDEAVKARADLVGKAKSIADADYAGKSEAEIKRQAVGTVLGDAAIKDRSDAYIDARFDVLLEDASNTGAGGTNQGAPAGGQLQDAQANYEAKLYGEA